MSSEALYTSSSKICSVELTKAYSTSFYVGIRMFSKPLRQPICAIYGFVRLADEIVDTFHEKDKRSLLNQFRLDTISAIEQKISMNPILHSFQETVNTYQIPFDLIDAFLKSMEMDLEQNIYNSAEFEKYVYGSAEVVGLMCLHVFTNGNKSEYLRLELYAKSLGSAFQKINFLRDLRSDYVERGRVYFPGLNINPMTLESKLEIEAEIKKEFDHALIGIKQLPKSVRLGVYVAYTYYLNLFKKIKSAEPSIILSKRFRVNNFHKCVLLFRSWFNIQLRFL
ncbi:MAG: phytoene/squalene synthase family protein [Saprospiraceae bacterium]